MAAHPAPGEDPFAAIHQGIADARVDEAATARARAHWLAQQAEDDVTLVGALVDLTEQGKVLRVRLRGGAELTGAARAVGADVVVLHTPTGEVLVRIDRLITVRSDSGFAGSPTRPDRSSGSPTFLEVLHDRAARQPRVQVHTDDAAVILGTLRAMGADVLTLRVGEGPTATVLVSLSAVTAVGILDAR